MFFRHHFSTWIFDAFDGWNIYVHNGNGCRYWFVEPSYFTFNVAFGFVKHRRLIGIDQWIIFLIFLFDDFKSKFIGSVREKLSGFPSNTTFYIVGRVNSESTLKSWSWLYVYPFSGWKSNFEVTLVPNVMQVIRISSENWKAERTFLNV